MNVAVMQEQIPMLSSTTHTGTLEAAIREAGKLGIEGKDYVVQDGDIMHFRFNV